MLLNALGQAQWWLSDRASRCEAGDQSKNRFTGALDHLMMNIVTELVLHIPRFNHALTPEHPHQFIQLVIIAHALAYLNDFSHLSKAGFNANYTVEVLDVEYKQLVAEVGRDVGHKLSS